MTEPTMQGKRLTAKEQVFANVYIENLDLEERDRIKKACEATGLKPSVMRHEALQNEISERISSINSHRIANAEEILAWYTKVMRGQELDAFGMDASIADRLKAADSLAKRILDKTETDNAFTIKIVR